MFTVIAVVCSMAVLYGGLFLIGKMFSWWVMEGCCTAICLAYMIYGIVEGDQVTVACNALGASAWGLDFWNHRPPRMRGKGKKLVGAKARAVKEKLVKSMPSAAPVARPVLV